MASEVGFEAVEVEPPAIPDAWSRGRSKTQRKAIAAYSWARRWGVSRSLLRAFGPLWQLRATRRGGA